MSYKSPIDFITSEIRLEHEKRIDGDIFHAVQEIGITVDKEQLLKALRYDRNQYEKGYKDGYDDGLHADKWVSVDDRLPDKHTRVLCYFKYEPESSDVICENTYFSGGFWLSDGSKVTHWQPLPEPPAERKEQ